MQILQTLTHILYIFCYPMSIIDNCYPNISRISPILYSIRIHHHNPNTLHCQLHNLYTLISHIHHTHLPHPPHHTLSHISNTTHNHYYTIYNVAVNNANIFAMLYLYPDLPHICMILTTVLYHQNILYKHSPYKSYNLHYMVGIILQYLSPNDNHPNKLHNFYYLYKFNILVEYLSIVIYYLKLEIIELYSIYTLLWVTLTLDFLLYQGEFTFIILIWITLHIILTSQYSYSNLITKSLAIFRWDRALIRRLYLIVFIQKYFFLILRQN